MYKLSLSVQTPLNEVFDSHKLVFRCLAPNLPALFIEQLFGDAQLSASIAISVR